MNSPFPINCVSNFSSKTFYIFNFPINFSSKTFYISRPFLAFLLHTRTSRAAAFRDSAVNTLTSLLCFLNKSKINIIYFTNYFLVNVAMRLLIFISTSFKILFFYPQLLSVVCQMLVMNYGIPYSATLGLSYSMYLTTCSASILTTLVIIITYTISPTSRSLVRSSVLVSITVNILYCVMKISRIKSVEFYVLFKFTSHYLQQ